ncbi:MAG: ATP-dependent helicase [Planctomycetes bacterium]|nr:ATP-dependent helicase [Planctomycetota bacterium]
MEKRKPNTAQRAAIVHSNGPLVVLAGPGTGKTFVIIERVAHLIQERGIDPEHILAVTFTVKAAAELRQRLAKIMDAGVAERVQAHTFNGFGMRLVQRYADVLGLPPNLTMIDKVQSRRLIRDLVVTNGLFPDCRAEGLKTLVVRIEKAIEGMQNLGALPDDAQRAAEAWGRRVAGAAGSDDDEAAADRLAQQRFADETRVYGLFTAARRAKGWISYADQITLPIELLRRHSAAAATVRADLRAVIVDEFQDCNPGQIELLKLLIGPRAKGAAPDVCVVGDDDQAIYGFRGSDDRAFQRFESIWPNPTVVALTQNYRSAAPIVDAANSVIARASSRFRPEKTIVPASADAGGVVEGIKLGHDFDDAEVIPAAILAERAKDSALDLSDIAIIVRTGSDMDRVCAGLSLYGVKFERSRTGSPMEDEGVADVRAWIEWLVEPQNTWPVLRILSRPPFGVPPEVVAEIDSRYRAERSKFEQGAEGVQDPGAYADYLLAEAQRRPAQAPAITRAVEKFRALRTAVTGVRADEAVRRVIELTGAAHSELLPGRDAAARVSALVALLAISREKQPRLAPPGELRQLWEYLQELDDARDAAVQGPIEPVEPGESEESQGRVRVMTAHASKGLEFATVYVPRVSPPWGFPKPGVDEEGWKAPRELFDPLDTRDEKTRRLDEERRLFYVACTRAKRRLVLMAKYNKKPSNSAVHFFEELVPHGGAPRVGVVRTTGEVLSAASALGHGPPAWGQEDPGAQSKERVAEQAASADRAAEWAARMRRRARMVAAAALEAADTPGLAPERLAEIEERLNESARMMATIAAVERTGQVPAWAGQGEIRKVGESLAAIRAGQTSTDDAWGLLLKPQPGPLDLSYTYIRAYLECPRCFYLHRVMGLKEPESQQAALGTIVHVALQRFYEEWSKADAEGARRPGMDAMMEIGRRVYHEQLGPREEADRGLLEQVQAQLSIALTRLHSETDHILELERLHRFGYEVDGVKHRLTAKIDRVDQLADGLLRVVDYKTGAATKKLTEPAADDLQMGIYVLALQQAFPAAPPRGVAEYWVLSEGVRGQIAFDKLKLEKVRGKIDEAVRGITQGEFPIGKDCQGPCRMFEV